MLNEKESAMELNALELEVAAQEQAVQVMRQKLQCAEEVLTKAKESLTSHQKHQASLIANPSGLAEVSVSPAENRGVAASEKLEAPVKNKKSLEPAREGLKPSLNVLQRIKRKYHESEERRRNQLRCDTRREMVLSCSPVAPCLLGIMLLAADIGSIHMIQKLGPVAFLYMALLNSAMILGGWMFLRDRKLARQAEELVQRERAEANRLVKQEAALQGVLSSRIKQWNQKKIQISPKHHKGQAANL